MVRKGEDGNRINLGYVEVMAIYSKMRARPGA